MAQDEDILNDLAQKIETIRVLKRLKDTDVEDAGGVSRQLLSDFRNGKRSISLKSFIRILRGIGELERIEKLFPDTRQFSPLSEKKPEQAKRVRDKEVSSGGFKWGDEK
jgi:transcriptional regulator with XRE-family HTH domain